MGGSGGRPSAILVSSEEKSHKRTLDKMTEAIDELQVQSESMRDELAAAERVRPLLRDLLDAAVVDLTLLAVVMQSRLEREAPKVTTVGTAQFSTRVAALRASRLEAEELPEGLRPEAPPSPGRWPRRTPSPSKDCKRAIVRGEMGHRYASIQTPWGLPPLHTCASLVQPAQPWLALVPLPAPPHTTTAVTTTTTHTPE